MKYCLDCGFVGEPESNTPGTASTEVLLWFLLVVPGAVYSLWRRVTRYQGCQQCGSRYIVAVESAVARTAFRMRSPVPSLKPWACLACGDPIFSGGIFCRTCATQVARASDGIALLRA
jgi:hypothetical protein